MRRFGLVLAFLFAFGISMQMFASTREQAATEAAQKWLALVDSGQYGGSWSGASTGFKKAVTEEQWKGAMNGVRQPLGAINSRTVKSAEYKTSLPGAPDGEYVVIQFDTSFANKKGAVETVTMSLEKDGSWRAAGYFIR